MDPDAQKTYGSESGCGCGSGFGTLVHLHHSSKMKKIIKKSLNSRNQGFLTSFA
jgi:hypothetical protein